MQVCHITFDINKSKELEWQDNCPMCHEKLYQTDATSQTEEEILDGLPPEVAQNIAMDILGDDDSDDYTDLTDSEAEDI